MIYWSAIAFIKREGGREGGGREQTERERERGGGGGEKGEIPQNK